MSSPEEVAKPCWVRGNKAVSNEQYDFAVQMFHTAAMIVPDNYAYREALRAAQFKMYKDNKKGAGMMAKPKLISIRTKLSRLKSKEQWDEVDKLAEEGLKLNPWDAQLNAAVGEACQARGYDNVAILAYQVATGPAGEPENVKLLKQYAALLQENARYKEAANIWRKVQKLDPNDAEARRNVTSNSFEQTIKEGNYDDAQGTKDVMTDKQISDKLGLDEKRQQGQAAPGMDPELDLKHAIRKDPKSVELHQKLAGLYDEKDQFDDAIEMYQKALELSGGDRNIQEMIEDIEIRKMNKTLEKYKAKAQANPDDSDAGKKRNQFARKVLDHEIKVYAARAIQYPQNKQLKFDLARRYGRLHRWSDAIPLYQQAATSPRLETASFMALGKCFLQDKKPQLALKQFEKIQSKLSFEDNADDFKEVHYLLGRLHQQFGNKEKAEDHYGEVLAVDYDYRDVRDRLAELGD